VSGASLAILAGLLVSASPAEPLLAADRELDDSVGRRDRKAFLALLEPGAVFTGPTLLQGRDAVWARWSRFFDPAGPTLRWRPTDGGIAASGDLGWTTGEARYEWKEKGVLRSDLRYLTIWRRGADGRWVAAIDGSLEPVRPGKATRTPARTVASRDGTMEAAIGTYARGSGSGRETGIYLVLRERRDGAWRVVRESEIPSPPGR
jgi:ketosteroid isomerase-like protein